MDSVFKERWFPSMSEQAAIDTGIPLAIYRAALQGLVLPDHGRARHNVVDLGCGTGISTEALLTTVPNIRVAAVDANRAMIDFARYKFGHTQADPQSTVVMKASHYPTLIQGYAEPLDLETHVHDTPKRLEEGRRRFDRLIQGELVSGSHVEFSEYRAGFLHEYAGSDEKFDLVFVPGTFRWFRRHNVQQGGSPNSTYEKKVCEDIYQVQNTGGLVVALLRGEDIALGKRWECLQWTQEPFTLAFNDSLEHSTGRSMKQHDPFDFTIDSFLSLFPDDQYHLVSQDIHSFPVPRQRLVELAFVSGLTDLMKRGAESNVVIAEKHLREAAENALRNVGFDPNGPPVYETAIILVARKK